jgi:TonB-dependent SusC/RagA subfamily outer membrane receptor
VIDGFIGGDINSVAPEDIESMEILKDASSTAIYGARGGNGVILVTTKRGESNQNRIDFSYYHSISNVSKKMDLLDREGYCTLRNRALTTDGLPAQFTQGQIDGTEPINGYIADTDWQDEIFRTAQTNYYNLSIAGGSGKTSYALSANYRKENGVIYNSDFTRGGVRLNLDHEINKKMNVGVSANAYRTEGNSFNVTTGWSLGAAGGAITSFPYYPLYDSTGNTITLLPGIIPDCRLRGRKIIPGSPESWEVYSSIMKLSRISLSGLMSPENTGPRCTALS